LCGDAQEASKRKGKCQACPKKASKGFAEKAPPAGQNGTKKSATSGVRVSKHDHR
jgi:hypothetical protein